MKQETAVLLHLTAAKMKAFLEILQVLPSDTDFDQEKIGLKMAKFGL